jgi:hypothetical protein
MRRLAISALLLLLPCLRIGADDPPPVQPPPPELPEIEADYVPPRVPKTPLDYRRHLELRDAQGALLYEYTVISSISEAGSSEIIPLRDPGHGDVLLENITTVDPHRSVSRISDVKRRAFIESSMDGPFASKTLSETFKEAHAHPELYKTAVPITIKTGGGEWRMSETELKDQQLLRRLRHEIRPTVDVYLLEAVERMRATFFQVTDGASYSWLLGQVLLYGADDKMDFAAEARAQPPACDFDESFGYPCSDEQQKRVKAAAEAGKPLPAY